MSNHNGSSTEDPGKRLAILEQAIDAFAELGFRGTDVQMIADRAGVGKGTIYRYFHSKEDLFWATTFEVVLRLEKHIFGAMEGVTGAIEKIRAATMAYAEFFEQNPSYLEVFVQDRAEFRGAAPESHREHHREMHRQFETIIQQGIEEGEIRPIDAYKTVHGFASLLYGTVVHACHLSPMSAVQMAEHNVEIYLQGIRAEKSRTEGSGSLAPATTTD